MPCYKDFSRGFCADCGTTHSLPAEPAMAAAQQLMQQLTNYHSIDFSRQNSKAKESSTDFLYGKARGKMFGVLSCETAEGTPLTLKAFSGQYNGVWEVEDWVPPLFDVDNFWQLLNPIEKEIKALGKKLKNTDSNILRQQRKKLSQKLMKQLHKLYRLHNFNHQKCTLADLFPENRGIPTGTGDCCAPKLLNHAALHGLKPTGLAEFYWGKANRSATRFEGEFYPPCSDKCGPILGFLLCGIEN